MKIVEGQLYVSKPELSLIRQAYMTSMVQPELYLHYWLDPERNSDALQESVKDDSDTVHDPAFLREAIDCWLADKYTEVDE